MLLFSVLLIMIVFSGVIGNPTSQAPVTAMFILIEARMLLSTWQDFQWHAIHNEFDENGLVCMILMCVVESRTAHSELADEGLEDSEQRTLHLV
jgi:hypothetical protein